MRRGAETPGTKQVNSEKTYNPSWIDPERIRSPGGYAGGGGNPTRYLAGPLDIMVDTG
jgi:hypothetical protein